MRSKFNLSLVCTAVLFAGAGCHHASFEPGPAAPPGDSPMAPPASPGLNRAVILDDAAEGAPRLTIERQGSVRLGPGALEVYATLRNRTAAPLRVEVRARYFGTQQEPLEAPAEWQPLTLQPAGLVTFKGRSPASVSAGYFLIEVREARP